MIQGEVTNDPEGKTSLVQSPRKPFGWENLVYAFLRRGTLVRQGENHRQARSSCLVFDPMPASGTAVLGYANRIKTKIQQRL